MTKDRRPLIGINADYYTPAKGKTPHSIVHSGYYECLLTAGAIPIIIPPIIKEPDQARPRRERSRDEDQKQAAYAALAERLEARCGVRPEDLIVSMTENTPADWSFGMGRAQFLTGEL